jgi:hypothetical protein
MKIQKLQLSKNKIDINLQFYFFLKHTVKLKPTDKQSNLVIENIQLFKNDSDVLLENLEKIFVKSKPKTEQIREIWLRILSSHDIELFDFALRLYQIKDLLLQEAKISEILDVNNLSKLDPLSLEYDKISVLKPYKTRVSGALLSLLFFEKLDNGEVNFMSQDSCDFILDLSKKGKNLKLKGLESNQVFMLMFSESINQSIISDSGSNYENRILSVLNKAGIENITKEHDKNDKSTEFDHFFDIEGKTYGIGAKRTLRERYKQFIKTALTSEIDVMITITLGVDLNEEKAKTIIKHGVYIFVSDEIYQTREFLQKIDKVYSVKNLNLETLKKLK